MTTTLNPLQTQSRVQTSDGVSRETHTQRLSGDEYTTAGDEYTAAEDDWSKHISRPASTRTVCDSGQGRGHYVKAVCIVYNEVPNTCNSIQLRGRGGGRDTVHTAVIRTGVCIINIGRGFAPHTHLANSAVLYINSLWASMNKLRREQAERTWGYFMETVLIVGNIVQY